MYYTDDSISTQIIEPVYARCVSEYTVYDGANNNNNISTINEDSMNITVNDISNSGSGSNMDYDNGQVFNWLSSADENLILFDEEDFMTDDTTTTTNTTTTATTVTSDKDGIAAVFVEGWTPMMERLLAEELNEDMTDSADGCDGDGNGGDVYSPSVSSSTSTSTSTSTNDIEKTETSYFAKAWPLDDEIEATLMEAVFRDLDGMTTSSLDLAMLSSSDESIVGEYNDMMMPMPMLSSNGGSFGIVEGELVAVAL